MPFSSSRPCDVQYTSFATVFQLFQALKVHISKNTKTQFKNQKNVSWMICKLCEKNGPVWNMWHKYNHFLFGFNVQ